MVEIEVLQRRARAAVVFGVLLLMGTAENVEPGRTGSIAIEQGRHSHHAPGSIIGKDTPHLIPDEIAVALLFRTLADLADRGSLSTYMKRIQDTTGHSLTQTEHVAILSAAQAFREQSRVAIQNDPERYEHHLTNGAREAWLSLSQSMTPTGHNALQRYLNGHYKSTIKILKERR